MDPKIEIKNLNFYYDKSQILKDINLSIKEQQITAIIGPSGCGKTTLLRTLNRMTDLIPQAKLEGEILLEGKNICAPAFNVVELRRKVGMVFQQPNPFPKSIYENVAFGLKVLGLNYKSSPDEQVEKSLKLAALWDEVKDNLKRPGTVLSGGQQQRLCIARVLAVEPEVILMDEPCSSLDPIASLKIEGLMKELKKQYTIVIVTHNIQQAARVSDYTAFVLMAEERAGELIEYGPTRQIFTNPRDKRAEDYITGRFG